MTNDSGSLSHTKWNCKYHIVFAPKYRRQEIYGRIKQDIGQILRKLCEAKKCRDTGSRSMPGPYPYAGEYTAEYKRITVYGVSEGKKFADDIRSACEPKVQVWESPLLVSGLLCGYGRTEQRKDCRIHTQSVAGRHYVRPANI